MVLVLMCPASDTRHSPKTCVRRWSRSFRASTSSKKYPWGSLRVLSKRRSRQKERVTRISARTSSATTSGAISTSRSRIHLFRIRESVKSRHPYGSRVGGELLLQGQLSGLPLQQRHHYPITHQCRHCLQHREWSIPGADRRGRCPGRYRKAIGTASNRLLAMHLQSSTPGLQSSSTWNGPLSLWSGFCRLSAAQCLFEYFPLLLSYFGHFCRCIEHLCRPVATLR